MLENEPHLSQSFSAIPIKAKQRELFSVYGRLVQAWRYRQREGSLWPRKRRFRADSITGRASFCKPSTSITENSFRSPDPDETSDTVQGASDSHKSEMIARRDVHIILISYLLEAMSQFAIGLAGNGTQMIFGTLFFFNLIFYWYGRMLLTLLWMIASIAMGCIGSSGPAMRSAAFAGVPPLQSGQYPLSLFLHIMNLHPYDALVMKNVYVGTHSDRFSGEILATLDSVASLVLLFAPLQGFFTDTVRVPSYTDHSRPYPFVQLIFHKLLPWFCLM